MRLHRSLKKKIDKIDANYQADRAEDYLFAVKENRKIVSTVKGLHTETRIKNSLKKVDQLEAELIRLEKKIEKIEERRNLEALKLKAFLDDNLYILNSDLDKSERKEFKSSL